MGAKAQGSTVFSPVGNAIDNGFDNGGARIYPFSNGLAITPSSYYSDYVGSAQSLPVTPPVAAMAGTTGTASSASGQIAAAMSSPFGKNSPLAWVLVGLIGAVVAIHLLHYK